MATTLSNPGSASPIPAASDKELLELVRIAGPVSIAEISAALEVTPTAVRQRLSRLLARGLVRREPVRGTRGRPKHTYELTELGRRQSGSNFTDLAIALWKELNSIENKRLQKVVLRRIAEGLAAGYASDVQGDSPAQRMRSLAELLREREIPASVDEQDGKPTLVAHACPYPDLAEEDPSICVMERMLFAKLLGCEIELSKCRLDGADTCQFRPDPTMVTLSRVDPRS